METRERKAVVYFPSSTVFFFFFFFLKVLRVQDFLEPHAKGAVSRQRRGNVKRESQECRRDRVRQGRVKHHRRRLPGVGVHDVHDREHRYKHWSVFAFVQLRSVFARVRLVRVIREFRYFLPIGNAVKRVRLIFAVSNNELCAFRIQFVLTEFVPAHAIIYTREKRTKEEKQYSRRDGLIQFFIRLQDSPANGHVHFGHQVQGEQADARAFDRKYWKHNWFYKLGGDIYEAKKHFFFLRVQKYNEGVLYIYNKNLMKDQFFSAKLLLD